MTEDEESVYVDSEIEVGGSIPASVLNTFVKQTTRYIYEKRYTGNHLPNYLRRTEEMLHTKIKTLDNATLDMNMTSHDGIINGDFYMLCLFHKLFVKTRTAPFVNHNGQHMNEMVSLYIPEYTHNPILIPTDGKTKPTTLVEDVFVVINDIFNEYEKPDTDAPRYINDKTLTGEIARRKLAGEDLRKILTEHLKSRISYPDQTLPPFKVLKGV